MHFRREIDQFENVSCSYEIKSARKVATLIFLMVTSLKPSILHHPYLVKIPGNCILLVVYYLFSQVLVLTKVNNVSETEFSNILGDKHLLGVTLAEAMRNPQSPTLA